MEVARWLQTFRGPLNVMWSMADFLHSLDSAGHILTTEEVARATRSGTLYLQCYQWLAVETDRKGQRLWAERPKLHYFWHVIQALQLGLNPKSYQCDNDESYMNTMKQIGSKCHGASVQIRMMQRYLLGLGVRILKRVRTGTWLVG